MPTPRKDKKSKKEALSVMQGDGAVTEKLEPAVSAFGAEEHADEELAKSVAPHPNEKSALNTGPKVMTADQAAKLPSKTSKFSKGKKKADPKIMTSAEETTSYGTAATKELSLAPAVTQSLPVPKEETAVQPQQTAMQPITENFRDTSDPGAYRVMGIGYDAAHDDEESTHYTGDVVGDNVSQVASTINSHTVGPSNTGADFHVPVARTVDDKVFEAIPDDGMDKKRQQRKIAIIVMIGVLVVIGVVLGAVLGTRKGSDPTPAPTVAPTRELVEWARVGDDILGLEPGDESGIAIDLSEDGMTLAVAAIFYDAINNTIAVNNTRNDTGLVRVFSRVENEWVQQGSDIEGEHAGDQSGTSVALARNGTILAIGAFLNDGSLAGIIDVANYGHVRVFEWSGTDWVQLGEDIDGIGIETRSGFSVALSSDGHTVAIGGPGYNGRVGVQGGHVRVFQWSGAEWVILGQQTGIQGEGGGDLFGESVSLSSDGHIVAAGALRNDPTPEKENAGHVRVFEWNDTAWNQLGADIDGEAKDDESGTSPSVVLTPSGKTVAIGATMHDGVSGADSGHVRVFDYLDNEWVLRGDDIQGLAGDELGSSVSISNDGKTVLIGALASRRQGSNSGTARLYHWFDTQWLQLGEDIDGSAADDQSGVSVSLSGDGSIVAIGAPKHDGDVEESDVGQVRVFERVVEE